jgi:four helix bundle protein
MGYEFSFEKLRVWQDARGWVHSIYALTRRFPSSENYGLTSQLNRASVSVVANLAEGAGRVSPRDQAHFSQLAYGSLMESMCLLLVASDQGFLSGSDLENQRTAIEQIANQINALRISQLARSP